MCLKHAYADLGDEVHGGKEAAEDRFVEEPGGTGGQKMADAAFKVDGEADEGVERLHMDPEPFSECCCQSYRSRVSGSLLKDVSLTGAERHYTLKGH